MFQDNVLSSSSWVKIFKTVSLRQLTLESESTTPSQHLGYQPHSDTVPDPKRREMAVKAWIVAVTPVLS